MLYVYLHKYHMCNINLLYILFSNAFLIGLSLAIKNQETLPTYIYICIYTHNKNKTSTGGRKAYFHTGVIDNLWDFFFL